MGSILIPDLDDDVIQRLRERAERAGRSLEAEVRLILEQAAGPAQWDMATARARIEELQKRFKGRKFPDTVDLIREDRDR